MMNNTKLYSIGALLLVALLFGVLTLLSSNLLTGARIDLTENRLYTLSEGTINILESLEEPVTLYYFFSEDSSRDLPQIRTYAKRVQELLDEFISRSDGALILHRIDPKPFSEEEDEAASFGLQAVPIGAGGETLYLGIAGTNMLDDIQTMPFLQPTKEQFLEYDLAKMISTLGSPTRRVMGLLSTLPMDAGYEPAQQRMREAWVVRDQLEQLFEVKSIEPSSESLPEDIEVLMLVHPKELSESMLYQIDQFVLGGGRLIAYMDPFAEADRGDPNDPMARMQAGGSSTLGKLLDQWGVVFDTSLVVGDLEFGAGNSQARHIGILSVPAQGLNGNDIVSGDLEVVNFSSTGWLQAADGAVTSFETLAQSSANAAPLSSTQLQFLTNPADLMTGFSPTGDRYTLAARVTGEAQSAFANPPEGFDASAHVSAAGDDGITVLLFADTDFLTDRLWVQKQPFLGQSIISAFADNGNFAINAVDNMLGNRDLISIRTRASSGRPLDRVEAIRVAAENSYRATEEGLQQELAETERTLTELQTARGDSDLMVLNSEQQDEVQRFLDRKLEIRRELRQVQHDLQRDIEALGTRLKMINIVILPAMVMLLALVLAARRRRRQAVSPKQKQADL
jgi:ABC-type uncharacterized transport system involved in gliding motility auxiliary subunit